MPMISGEKNAGERKKLEDVANALKAGSLERRVLLAYWKVSESSPWNEAQINLVDKQSYNDLGFPDNESVKIK